jgi:hypothetical protein
MDGALMAYDTPDNPGDKPTRKVKVPEGYRDEAEFCEEVRELFQQGVDHDRENCEEGVADLEFLGGEQWDADARKARAGKPCLTINDLPAKVAQVVGDMRINRPSIRVRPAEDADKDLAEIREGLIRAIERDNDAQGVYIETGENQVACGIGNFRIAIKNSDDTGFERDIAIQAIPDAFAVVWDPYSVERTGRDAEWCFVVEEMPRKAFERRWKDKTPADLDTPTHGASLNGWETKDAVRIVEFWRMKDEPALYARLESGATVEVVEDGMGGYMRVQRGRKVANLPLPQPVAVDEAGEPMVQKGVRKYACMYLVTGTAILSGPHELPIPRLPIMRARGWQVTVRKKRIRFGLVRFARDPARLKNYWRSVSAEMLALAGKGNWLLHEQTEGDQEQFREAYANDERVLIWSGQVKPEYVGPPMLNNAVLQEAALAAQDMKDVTGLHDASLGARSNETSGKAIIARQKEGDVGSYIYHDNLQAAIAEGGRVINALIPVTHDTARTIRIVGEDETTKVQRINDPNDPSSIDINRGRYDIVVETGPSYSTKRVEAAESMAQFFQVVPAAAQAAGDLFARAQDWPMADEIGERLKKTLPPNLTEGEEELTPEQQQQRQMAMQQQQEQQAMQQQAMQLEMAEKGAKVKLAEAQAVKAMREADAMGQPEGPPDAPEPFAVEKAEAELRKALADADLAAIKVERELIALEADKVSLASDVMDVENKPEEQAMTRAQSEKALNEPPKQPGKPKA